MEKLTQIMNSFEIFLEIYDTCSKSEVIYNWQQLERKIKDILEEKEANTGYICPHCKGDLCIKEIKEQIIKCGYGGVLTPVKEVEINSWQDGNRRKWKCGCGGLMECETGSDRVITCPRCYRKYVWEDKTERVTYISEKGEDELFAINMKQVVECDNKYQNLVKEVNSKNDKNN